MIIDVATALEQKITEILTRTVGVGTDPTNFVKLFDDHLHDVEITLMPFVVVTARSAEQGVERSIGQHFMPRDYIVHIYYLDLSETFPEGKARRNLIVEKMASELEQNYRLDNFSLTDPAGNTEHVWDTDLTNILLDYSGQDEYYSFVSELYLTVHTDRN